LRGSGSEEYRFYGQEITSITLKGDGDLFGNVLFILEHDLEIHCVVKNKYSDILYFYLQISNSERLIGKVNGDTKVVFEKIF
jgi:hypothetical protein